MSRYKYEDSNQDISNGGRLQSYWRDKTKNKISSMAGVGFRSVDMFEIQEKYKLKGFEFGRWLTTGEREDWINACEISLRELANVIGSNNIGIDGEIGLAFGARGRNGALAHYEPGTNMINLTKEKGQGALAHEYGHALDYCFGR